MNYSKFYWEDVAAASEIIPNVERLFHKRILITGATGMVCSAVVEVLAYLNESRNAGITLLLAGRDQRKMVSRFQGGIPEDRYEFVQFDSLNPAEMLVKADYFIHGAGNADPVAYVGMPSETLMGNLVGLNTILTAARRNEGSRTLFISSSEVYGERSDEKNAPYKETEYGYVDILNPRACYPNAKRAAETLCACFGREFGVDTVIVRPGHIYGPTINREDTRASAAFTWNAVEGDNIKMKSSGGQLRSYCYTLDCASALLTVLCKGKTGEAYNISNRNTIVSIREIAEQIAAAGGVEVEFVNPSDRERMSYNLMKNSALDSEKLESLGWRAVFPLPYAIKRTIDILKASK